MRNPMFTGAQFTFALKRAGTGVPAAGAVRKRVLTGRAF